MHSPGPTPRPPLRPLPQAGGPAMAPPLALPALHFAATLGWLAVAAPVLLLVGPRLVRGLVFDPLVIAFVHIVMLGAMGSAIFGTLLQFVPGGLGVPLRSFRLGYWGFWLFQIGVLALVTGFWWWRGALQGIGWLFIFAAVGAHSRNTLRARRHSVNGRLVATYVTVAHSALGFGMAIAAARIGETLGWWHVDRLYLLAAHALLGAVGFGTLSAIGVGSRMIPTFLSAPGDDRRWLVWHLWLTSIGLAVFALGAVLTQRWLLRAGSLTVLVGGALATWLLASWFRRRQRSLDAPLRHVALAAIAFGTAVVMGVMIFVGSPLSLHHWAAALLVLLLGWLIMLVIGVMSKILPHITFLHLAPSRPRLRAMGSPNNLLRTDWQILAASGLAGGWMLLALGVWMQHRMLVTIGAVSWSVGTVAVVANYVRLFVMGLPRTAPKATPETAPASRA